MRRLLLPFLLFLVWTPSALATPTVSAQATPASGQAPLEVTLTATGNAVSYHWELGDRTTADGPVAQHRYEAGRYKATVTATGADGTTAQASVTISALMLTLRGPHTPPYARRTPFKGRLVPVPPGAVISLYAGEAAVRSVRADKKGHFRFRLRPRSPANYTARFESAASNA